MSGKLISQVLVYLLAFNSPGWAKECPKITEENACDYFPNDTDPVVRFSENEFVPNPRYEHKLATRANDSMQTMGLDEMMGNGADRRQRLSAERIWKLQVEYQGIVESLPEEQFSESSKTWLLMNMPFVTAAIKGEVAGGKFYYPADFSSGETKIVSGPAAEFKRAIESKLAPQKLEQIKKATKEADDDLLSLALGDAAVIKELQDFYKNQTDISESRRSEVEAMVEFAQKELEAIVAKSAAPGSRATDIAALKTKIKTVKYVDASNDPALKESCGHHINAFYNPASHTFTICPAAMNLPNETLVSIIGHELGHSVDPCNCRFGVHKIHHQKSYGDLKATNRSDLDLARIYQVGKSGDKSDYTAYPFEVWMANANAVIDEETEKGRLSRLTSDIPRERSPLRSIFRCLGTDGKGKFRSPNEAQIREYVEKNWKQAVESGAVSGNADQQETLGVFLRNPDCLPVESQSQMGEASSDWFGSQVLESYLKKKGEGKKKNRLLSATAVFTYDTCMMSLEKQRLAQEGEQMAASDVAAGLHQTEQMQRFRAHPVAEKRINRIILQNPGVQSFIGCESSKDIHCAPPSQASDGSQQKGRQEGVVQ